MIYSSLLFIYGFLPVSMLIYHLSPKKSQPAVILGLSAAFSAMIGLRYLAFVSIYVLINYAFTRLIGHYRSKKEISLAVLSFAVFCDIISLFVFRTELFSEVRLSLGFPEDFFPIGISFLALSAIGMLVDVYSGKIEPERNIILFLLYMIFFPRLIMGPILRYNSFRKAMEGRKTDLSEIGVGLTIFVKGLAKKIIAADTLYQLYTAAHSTSLKEMSSLTAWLGMTAYVMCLYFTLSGFADMGTGVSYCFGIKMPQSFNYPLFSTKIRYFAARWHIQLIQWMRRYVTKPLFSHFSNNILRRMIYIGVWGLFGFWYTFSANGLIWGLLLGAGITLENKLSSAKLLNVTGIIYTFFAVMICFVFFSGESPSYSLRYIGVMAGGGANFADTFSLYLLKSYIVVLLIGMYASTDLFKNMMMRSGKNKVRTAVSVISPVMVLSLLIVCTALISYSGSSEMILVRL